MKTTDAYQHFDNKIADIKSYALELTKDFDTARFLYLETAHQVIKHNLQLEPDMFKDWLKRTMKDTYYKVVHRAN